MEQPSEIRVLLTHIEYIREGMDEVKTGLKGVVTQAADHENRIVRLEERTPAKSRGGFWGTTGFVGGLLTGLGVKLGGS